MTPPFKPVVESDESVANFDPEFTSADMRDVGLHDMDLDEEDPSADWVAISSSVSAPTHMPNGPLGSDRPAGATSPGPAATTAAAAATPASQGIDIAKSKRKEKADVPPLTNSVQEKFRGFTYHGESIVMPPAGLLAQQERERERGEAVEEGADPDTDEEVESDSPAGRYAKSRRRGEDAFAGFDEDMNV